jgi:uncharacterized protein (DUF1778 family)
MAVGTSGRVVIELDAEQKKLIHQAIKSQGMTLKQWFLEHAEKDFPHVFNKCQKDNLEE